MPDDISADILTQGVVNPHLYAYNNGFYDIGTDTFWLHDYTDYEKEQYAANIQESCREIGWGSEYTVKEVYASYREKNKLPKIRWIPDHYAETFHFLGIYQQKRI